MRRLSLAWAFLALSAVLAHGQACPKRNENGTAQASEVRFLEGRLVFHDDIRKWFELRLEQPQCGEDSIQLIRGEKVGTPIEVFRDCRVRSRGVIDFSTTGYFSRGVYQDVQAIEPVGECPRKSLFPDYSEAKPDKAIRAYRVDMRVHYVPGDHPIVFRVTSAGKVLRPWQAYASYWLTGGSVLYGRCAEGFVVDQVFGPPAARLGHFDEPGSPEDMAMFDPESAAEAGKTHLRFGYTCARHAREHQE